MTIDDILKNISLKESKNFLESYKVNQSFYKILNDATNKSKLSLNVKLGAEDIQKLILDIDPARMIEFMKENLLINSKSIDDKFLDSVLKNYELVGVGALFLNTVSLLKKNLKNTQ